VVVGTGSELNAHQSKELLPKFPHEVVVPVTDYGLGKTMQPENLFEEQLCNLRSKEFGGDRKEMGILRQHVHHYIYAITSLHHGKSCDEIHQDAFPFPLRNGERL